MNETVIISISNKINITVKKKIQHPRRRTGEKILYANLPDAPLMNGSVVISIHYLSDIIK